MRSVLNTEFTFCSELFYSKIDLMLLSANIISAATCYIPQVFLLEGNFQIALKNLRHKNLPIFHCDCITAFTFFYILSNRFLSLIFEPC